MTQSKLPNDLVGEPDFEEGDTFTDSRDDRDTIYKIKHIDESAVFYGYLHRGDPQHTMDPREAFDANVSAGRYELTDEDVQLTEPTLDLVKASYVGETTAERLRNNGYETAEDIRSASDRELKQIDGIGDKGLEGLRDLV